MLLIPDQHLGHRRARRDARGALRALRAVRGLGRGAVVAGAPRRSCPTSRSAARSSWPRCTGGIDATAMHGLPRALARAALRGRAGLRGGRRAARARDGGLGAHQPAPPTSGAGRPTSTAHRASARYYVDHWLPPKVGDPATLDSYSRDYGFSYINDTDPVYLFAGKFAALALARARRPRPRDPALQRAACSPSSRPCASRARAPCARVRCPCSSRRRSGTSSATSTTTVPALPRDARSRGRSPTRESAFNRFLDAPRLREAGAARSPSCVLAALLALSKKNFLSFLALLPALVACGAWAGRARSRSSLRRSRAPRPGTRAGSAHRHHDGGMGPVPCSFVAVFARDARAILGHARDPRARACSRGCAPRGARAGAHRRRATGGTCTSTARSRRSGRAGDRLIQQQIAKPEYKPSTIPQREGKSYYGIELRARGTPLSELFSPKWRWHSLTFATATGSYGWIQFTARRVRTTSRCSRVLRDAGVYALRRSARAARPGDRVGFAPRRGIQRRHRRRSRSSIHGTTISRRRAAISSPSRPMLGAGLLLVRAHGCRARAFAAAAAGACFRSRSTRSSSSAWRTFRGASDPSSAERSRPVALRERARRGSSRSSAPRPPSACGAIAPALRTPLPLAMKTAFIAGSSGQWP